jgi:hypothetical protein
LIGQLSQSLLYSPPEDFLQQAFKRVLDRLPGQVLGHAPIDLFPGVPPNLLSDSTTGPLLDPSIGLFNEPTLELSFASYISETSFYEGSTSSGRVELASGMPLLGGGLALTEKPQRVIGSLSMQDYLTPTGESFNDQVEATATEELNCKWPGCRTNKTFKRKYEYSQHIKKHTQIINLPCPIVYCPRQGSRSFFRWDKLFDHRRTGHTEDETSKCIVDGCTAPQMPLNLLRLHARYHDVDINKQPNLVTSCDFLKVLRSFSMAQKCDLKKCKRWFSADEVGYL